MPDFVSLPESLDHGPIKGEWKLSKNFFDELPSVDEKIKRLAREVRNICIVQGKNDHKSFLPETTKVFELLQEPKKMSILDTDHNFSNAKGQATELLIEWFRGRI